MEGGSGGWRAANPGHLRAPASFCPPLGLTGPLMCPQHPLLEEQSEDSLVPELDVAPQTCLTSDRGPQGLAGQVGDGGTQALDLASPVSDSALARLPVRPQASDSGPQVIERTLPTAAMSPQTSDLTLQESGSAVAAQESLEKAGHGALLQTPTSAVPSQDPETEIQAELSGGDTGESGPEAQVRRQEGPASKPAASELSLCAQTEEQETPGQGLDLLKGQTEGREHAQKLEGLVGDPAQQNPQQKSEGASEAQTWEGPTPGEILAGGVPEQEALREEVAQLKREAEALGAELEAQARRLEARGTEAARLSEELAQARKAEAEAQREVEARAGEQARLREAVEAAGRELEAAAREREALAEALATSGRERRQWEREGPRLRARAEAAEERLQVLESEGRQRLQEAERERQALKEVCWGSRPGMGNGGLSHLLGFGSSIPSVATECPSTWPGLETER